MRPTLFILALGALLAGPASAQAVMPPEQIRAILGATKGNWVAIRLYQGQDLLYFTHLESWRCGLEQVRFGINGAVPDTLHQIAECDPANPYAVPADHAIYAVFPPNSLSSVTVEVTYKDGVTATEVFERAAVAID